MRRTVLAIAALAATLGCERPGAVGGGAGAKPSAAGAAGPTEKAADATLRFVRDGREVRVLTRSQLVAQIPTVTVTQFDPYYAAPKTYRALPLRAVLELGMGAPAEELSKLEWVLRALDGYSVPIAGDRLFLDGAHLAIEDVEAPGWAPIGPQRALPGPYYMVWSKDGQQDTDAYPRPWQLATLEIAPFEALFPHTIPTGAGEAAQRGFALFKQQCIRCHMINREGGKVGPELNVPKNVLEYREVAYLEAFIKNPWSFRYGAMPPQNLTDAQLAELIAYLGAMRERKHDPDAGKVVSPH